MICGMPPPIAESRRLLDEVGSGDTKLALAALRDRLIAELDQAPSRYVAGLARELLAVLRELDRLVAPKPKRSIEDELKARRQLTARGEVPVRRNEGRRREEFPRRSGDPKKSS